jgi:hypothetical protein
VDNLRLQFRLTAYKQKFRQRNLPNKKLSKASKNSKLDRKKLVFSHAMLSGLHRWGEPQPFVFTKSSTTTGLYSFLFRLKFSHDKEEA